MEIQAFNRTFLRGLQTTRDARGAAAFNGFEIFQNVRTQKDKAERRGGKVLLGEVSQLQVGIDFAGTGEATCLISPEQWDFGRPEWCLEWLGTPASVTTAYTLMRAGTLAELYLKANGDVGFSLGTLTLEGPGLSLGVEVPIAVTRKGTAVALLVDGEVVDSGTMPALTPYLATDKLVIGSDGTADEYDGTMEYLHLRTKIPSSWAYRYRHMLAPRARGVAACYRGAPDANDLIYDHSAYERNVKLTASADASAAAARIHRHEPVQLLEAYFDENGEQRLFMVASGREYDGRI
jgi:hypothetical protein